MKRLLIANRGEIARRILRSARRRSLTVAVVSTAADAQALVRREADEVLEVGSFLDAEGIVEAAVRWGAELVHPGYGFLSEQASFAAAVERHGMVFVGPTPESMRALGGKESARALAAELGVPTLPALPSSELARLAPSAWPAALAERGIEAPYLVKAASGGGGRGMRVVPEAAGLTAAVGRASDEARAAFADGTVFIERFLESPRHVEIQVFGDGRGGGVFFGERECSLQRRHQKLFEEAPSSAVSPSLREALGRAALALVRATRYRGAGTVEFLLDPQGRFYFLEVNTRLQVEHPVTELVYGIDLVDAQLDLAERRWPESFPSPDLFQVPEPKGQAFEARVLAEDPRRGFLPTPGVVERYSEPSGPGVRVDSGIAAGSEVSPAFDSLLAKLIVHAADRTAALERMTRALEEFVIDGCGTNLSFLQALALHPDVRNGRFHTRWIDEHQEQLTARLPASSPLTPSRGTEPSTRALDGVGASAWSESALRLARQPQAFPSFPAAVAQRLDAERVGSNGRARLGAERVNAPMAGRVLEVRVAPGDRVLEGQVLFVIESMKMQLEIASPAAGVVTEVRVRPEDVLKGQDTLAVIGPPTGSEQEA